MEKSMIYLDNSATTRTLPEAAQAALAAMTGDFFNPAAAYGYGAPEEYKSASAIAETPSGMFDHIIRLL